MQYSEKLLFTLFVTLSDRTATIRDKTHIKWPWGRPQQSTICNQINVLYPKLRLSEFYDQLRVLTNRLCLILPFDFVGGAGKFIKVADSSFYRLNGERLSANTGYRTSACPTISLLIRETTICRDYNNDIRSIYLNI